MKADIRLLLPLLVAATALVVGVAAGAVSAERIPSCLLPSALLLTDNGLLRAAYDDCRQPSSTVYFEERAGGKPVNQQSVLPPIAAPPDENIDGSGPELLRSGNEYLLLTHRYPGLVPLPSGGFTANSTWVARGVPILSGGGVRFGPPELVGTAELSGGAAVSPSGLIGLVSAEQTGGTYVQVVRPGAFISTVANLGGVSETGMAGPWGGDWGGEGTIAFVDATTPIMASTNGRLGDVYSRVWTGGDYNNAANWSPGVNLGKGREPLLVTSRHGVVLFMRQGEALLARRWEQGKWSPPETLVAPTDGLGPIASWTVAADPGGSLHLVVAQRWTSLRPLDTNGLWTTSSSDGVSWSAPAVVAETAAPTQPDAIIAAFDHHDRAYVADENGHEYEYWWHYGAHSKEYGLLPARVRRGCRVCRQLGRSR